MGYPLALKVVGPVHKSDVGGVMLNLETAEMVRQAAEAMIERLKGAAPTARISGFIVQEMIRKPRAHELIAGMAVDRQFGPFLLFGQGGTAVEVINDKALALPPLNLALARELISQTRVCRQLQGYRDRPAVALDEVAMVLVRLSQLVADLDEVVEIDINPLLVDEKSAIALDARVRLAHRETSARGSRLAIVPYPRELERVVPITGIEAASLRPIRPEDSLLLEAMLVKVTQEDARRGLMLPSRSLEPRQVVRVTQIDYDREMAFVLIDGRGSARELLGVVRLAADPDNERGEFAVLVRSDLRRRGIGRLLMTQLIDYARSRGLARLSGHASRDNIAMLALCKALGLRADLTPGDDAGVQLGISLR